MLRIKERIHISFCTVIAALLVCLCFAVVPSMALGEPEHSDATKSTPAIETAGSGEITVPATVTSHSPTTLSATVSYNDNFVKGEPVRFTYGVEGGTGTLQYRLFSFDIYTSDGWTSVVDSSRGDAGVYSTKNYYDTSFYNAGKYRLQFNVMDGSGNYPPRFTIEITVDENDTLRAVETIVAETVEQCNSECSAKGDTSDYARALWLNDWLIDNTEYDSTLTYCGVEGVFGRGLGTCEGYHRAYVMLLAKAGIETRRVDDFGDTHVWTGVKLDGEWYNVDVTWNDSAQLNGFDLDMHHLYFALPSNIMGLVHKKWDGMYSVAYPDRAPFEASSYESNYFIRSGEILKYTKPYTESGSGDYSVRARLNAKKTAFELPAEHSSWPPGYKDVIYNLVAYQLGQTDWGLGNKELKVSYKDDVLSFQVISPLEGAQVTGLEDQPYTGKACELSGLRVAVEGVALTKGVDYEVSYENNVNVGTATVTIIGKGSYSGTKTASFKILQVNQGNEGSSGGNASTGSTNTGSNTGSSTSAGNNWVGNAQTPTKAPAVTGAWKKTKGKWWFSYNSSAASAQNKSYPASEWVTIKGKRYHFDSKGYMHAGWYRSGSTWYYLGSDGAMRTGWAKSGKSWYYLDGQGIMQTGWQKIAGKWYYLAGTGAMRTGWVSQGKDWYYCNASGAMTTGWQKVKGKWYYLNPSDGKMKTGFYDVGKARYYSDGSGAMKTGWQKIKNQWYYFNKSGAMQKSKWISGKYWVDADGVMAVNTWVNDGKGIYYVDSNGKWVPGKKR